MSHKNYKSHIDKPVVHTTSTGSSYVTAFDVVRSTAGRELIRKHAAMAKSLGLESGSPESNQSAPNGTKSKN